MYSATILIVEDDKAIRNLMTTAMETQNYKYYVASNGKEAILSAASNNPDMIILDLGLPDMDGVDIIKKIRGWSNVPIIVVSARSEDRDKIEALDAGADDYITKPFSVDELLARLRVTLRRIKYDKKTEFKCSSIFKNGNLKIDYAAGCVLINDEEIHLTPIEYKLLCVLAKNVGKVLTHNFLIKEVWGNVFPSDTPSLRVFMATLRRTIEKDTSRNKYIQTHIGVGYRMLRINSEEL